MEETGFFPNMPLISFLLVVLHQFYMYKPRLIQWEIGTIFFWLSPLLQNHCSFRGNVIDRTHNSPTFLSIFFFFN